LPTPQCGELWWFDPELGTICRELGRKVRPCLVISIDEMNQGHSEKVIIVPGTSVDHDIPSQVRFDYQLKGVPQTTYFSCEDVHSVSVQRLKQRMAPKPIPDRIMTMVERWVGRLIGNEPGT
jgi:mRNA-degrading endonuclease toxin of MazEF toxin-antitoxin module